MRPAEHFRKCGITIAAIARELRITPGAISQWEQVPAERVLDVERITGIPRGKLRPDLYPSDREPARC